MPAYRHAPIVRDAALAPLSRDHYQGLVQARRLLRAADEDDVARRRTVAEFVDAWDREILGHFRDEERLLTDALDDEDRWRLLEEHERLTQLAEQVRAMRRRVDPDPSLLRTLGEALQRHIRWEERELFARIQTRLGPSGLEALHRATAAIEAERPRDIRRTPRDERSPPADPLPAPTTRQSPPRPTRK